MFELIKTLIEQPEKIKGYSIFAIRIVLNIIFAAKLYVWAVGGYYIIDFSNFHAWVQFVLTGRILLCIFFYFASDFLLFTLLSIITTAPLEWMAGVGYTGKPDRSLKKIILWILRKTKVLVIDPQTNMPSVGKNTEAFQDFLALFLHEDSQKELTSLKHSLLNEIIHTFFVFIIIFYFGMDLSHHKTLNVLIITGAIGLSFFYLEICWVIAYMQKHAQELFEGLESLRMEKTARDILAKIGCYPFEVENPKEHGYLYYIFFKKKEYMLHYSFSKRPISESQIDYCVKRIIKEEKGMVFITKNELTRDALSLIEQHKTSIVLITFQTEEELENKLKDVFMAK